MYKDLGSWEAVNEMVDNIDAAIIKLEIKIKVCVENKEYSNLKITLQSLKGAAMYTHSEKLQQIAESFKEALEKGEYEKEKIYYPVLIKEINELRNSVRQYILKRDGIFYIIKTQKYRNCWYINKSI